MRTAEIGFWLESGDGDMRHGKWTLLSGLELSPSPEHQSLG
jgi:hypothetical protein